MIRINNQLPSFVKEEYPRFYEFINSFYDSQESFGFPFDIINNFMDYFDIENIKNQKEHCTLQHDIDSEEKFIGVDSTLGFNERNGLLLIDDEIILYFNKTDTSFDYCGRGYSGTKNYTDYKFEKTSATAHLAGAKVINLGYSLLKFLFERQKANYIPDYVYSEELNLVNFIKHIKSLYSRKGTSESFNILIRALFNVDNKVLYPRDNLFIPSGATYIKKKLIRVRKIQGNPLELVGQKLFQSSEELGILENYVKGNYVYINNVIEKFTETGSIFELEFDTYEKELKINPRTRLIRELEPDSDVVTVDSTIGFAESGYIKIDSEIIKYGFKNLNQFLGCQRGYEGTPIIQEVPTLVTVSSKYFGYSNIDGSLIEVDILGVLSDIKITDSKPNYFPEDVIKFESLGFDTPDTLIDSFYYNTTQFINISSFEVSGSHLIITAAEKHYISEGDTVKFYNFNENVFNSESLVTSVQSDTVFIVDLQSNIETPSGNPFGILRFRMKENIPCDVCNTYDQNQEYVYISSHGVPSHPTKITGFTSQNNLKRISRIPNQEIGNFEVGSVPVGIFINGVESRSFVGTKINFGNIINLVLDNTGKNYAVGLPPLGYIPDENYIPPSVSLPLVIKGNAVGYYKVNGSLTKINIIDGGQGYTKPPKIDVLGDGVGAIIEAVVWDGSIVDLVILNPGKGYTYTPALKIVGDGSGQIIDVEVKGDILEVGLTYSGSDYTEPPNVSIPFGKDANFLPVIENGKIVNIILVSRGSDYFVRPDIIINDPSGLGSGFKATVFVWDGQITDINIISQGINYSPASTITIFTTGSGAVIRPQIKEWTYNEFKRLKTLNYFDSGYGALDNFAYYYFGNPLSLRYQINDNINSDLSENPLSHSKILGWAYDGNPIYGSYGYSNPNQVSSTKRMISSYSIISNPNRPSEPLGTFCEDYVYDGTGDLDEHNGRFCVTPDFPQGRYCYFITSDANGVPVFPYILGKTFKNKPDSYNYSLKSSQNNIPSDAIRYTKNYFEFQIPNNIIRYSILQEDFKSYILQEDNYLIYLETDENQFKTNSKVTNVPRVLVSKVDWSSDSRIDSFNIIKEGKSYRVGDFIDFTYNSENDAAASAQVSFVNGVGVKNFFMNTYNKINMDNIVGNFVSGYNIFNISNGSSTTITKIDNKNKILYTPSDFSVDVGNIIFTSFDSSQTFGTGVSLLTNVSSGNTTFALGQTLNSLSTNIVLSGSANLNIGDYLKINNEIIQVFSGSGTSFSVYRGGFENSYSTGTTVTLLQNIRLTDNSDYQKGNYIIIDSEVFQIIDSTSNIFTVDRAKLNSIKALHTIGKPVYEIVPSSLKVSGTGTTTLLTLYTNQAPNLSQGDNIIFNTENKKPFPVIGSGSSSIILEYGVGTILENFDYYTDSKTTTGSIKSIKINSGGRNYKVLPSADIISSTGTGAEIFSVSKNIGKIQKISVLEPGYDFNPDFTLVPSGKFITNLNVNQNAILSSINIIDGGLGYTEIPEIEIIGGNPIRNASASATVTNGRISSIKLLDSGYGYTTKPTVLAKKKLPVYINTSNSTINFSKNIIGIISSGETIRIKTDGEYPKIFPNIQITENDVFFAILGGSLDSNQIRIALSLSDAINNIPVNFTTSGTGNLEVILDSNSAILDAVLLETDFLAGEKIIQYDNNGEIIASGTVSLNYGWQKLSNVLRIDNKSGTFSKLFPIFGESSKSYAIILEEYTSSAYGNIGFFYETQGEVVEPFGILNDYSQKILDSFFYQFYSYVLKNQIDYNDWQKEIKETVHPTGFKVFGQRIVDESLLNSLSKVKIESVSIKNITFSDLSLLNYYNYATAYPIYENNEVILLDKAIGKFVDISSSKVLVFDDISNQIVNTVVTGNDIELNSNLVSVIRKEDVVVVVNGEKISDVLWELNFILDGNFNKTNVFVRLLGNYLIGLPVQIILNGLNFDSVKNKFTLTVQGQNIGFIDRQILISLNGAIQRNSTYTLSLESGIYYITFSEAPLPRTVFHGLIFQRQDYLNNKILDDIGQSYITSSSISPNLKVYDGLFFNGFSCTILNISGTKINIGNIQGTISAGSTLFSGIISAGTSTTTTAINVPLVSTGTSFSVGSTTNFKVNDFIQIDSEVMRITGIGTTRFTVTRNQLGTSNDFHSNNSTVTKIIPVTVNVDSINYGFGTTTVFQLKSNSVPFTLPTDTGSELGQDYENSLITLINNNVQDSDAYNITGNKISFSENITEGNEYYSFYYGKLLLLDDISNNFNNITKIFSLTINNGSLFTIKSDSDISSNILVFLNGVLQIPNSSYNIFGSKILFTEAPQENSQFLVFAYIGSDSDIKTTSSDSDIEINDYLKLQREDTRRQIKNITDSTTLITNTYTNKIMGSGAAASTVVADGKVVSIDILNSGKNYTIPPIIYFIGNGKGASAYPIITNGKITDIILTSGGSNYTIAPQIIFAQSVDLYKQNRIRTSFESDYNKISFLTSELTISQSDFTGYNININNGEGFSQNGKILLYKELSGNPVYETIYYNTKNGNLLLESKRLYGYSYDRIFVLDANTYNFNLGQTITSGLATAKVIRYSDNLLFVKMLSGTFNNSNVIQDKNSVNATIVDVDYLVVYHTFPINTQVFQIE